MTTLQLLKSAEVGCVVQIAQLQKELDEIRVQLQHLSGNVSGNPVPASLDATESAKKGAARFSAAGLNGIRKAQKKRWAAFHAQKKRLAAFDQGGETSKAKPATKKKFSEEARRRMSIAQKKRFAAARKAA